MEADFLALAGRRVEGDRAGDERKAQIAFPICTGSSHDAYSSRGAHLRPVATQRPSFATVPVRLSGVVGWARGTGRPVRVVDEGQNRLMSGGDQATGLPGGA